MWTSILAAIVVFLKALPKILELFATLQARYDKWKVARKEAIALSRKDTKDAAVDNVVDRLHNAETIQQQPKIDKPPGLP